MLRTLEEKVDLKHAALLLVDVQNDFCHRDGFVARRSGGMSSTDEMIPKLIRLLSEARKEKLPVIYTRHVNSAWSMSAVGNEQRQRQFPDISKVACQEGSWGAEFYQELAPLPDECVVTKHRYSAFVGTDLDLILKSKGIKTLIMTGKATNICVESAARDGFMRDYYIVFLSDCTATARTEDQETTLRSIGNLFGVVATSEEVITAWQKVKQS